jgi:hypothetical protein
VREQGQAVIQKQWVVPTSKLRYPVSVRNQSKGLKDEEGGWLSRRNQSPPDPLVERLAEDHGDDLVYGRTLAAAEAMTVAAGTDPWAFSPAMLKPVADEIFAHGINRILVHESHHQPFVDKAPGLELGFFGQFFNRNDTWAEEAGPWVSYLSRTSYLLQQGHAVADVAVFYGEDQNLTERYQYTFNREIPAGYAFDYINPEALLELLSVRDGRLVTPGGASYRVLYLPAYVTRVTLPVLRKLRDLVKAGAIVVGQRPAGGLGLESPDPEVRALADHARIITRQEPSVLEVNSVKAARVHTVADHSCERWQAAHRGPTRAMIARHLGDRGHRHKSPAVGGGDDRDCTVVRGGWGDRPPGLAVVGVATAPEVFTVEAPLGLRGPNEFAERVRECIARMRAAGVRPAALLVDTIFGSDGVAADPAGFLAAAATEIHTAGGLFIADEVQPGFGRTGEGMWGYFNTFGGNRRVRGRAGRPRRAGAGQADRKRA